MLIEELVDDGTRVRHYSDEKYMIKQIETGILYEDAIDVIPCRYTYEETDDPIPEPSPPEPPELPEDLPDGIKAMINEIEAKYHVAVEENE